MTALAMLLLPALAAVAFILKLPEKFKEQFFKIPTWLSGTAVAIAIKSMLHFTGVFAPYAVIIMDLILMPSFELVKRYRKWKATGTPVWPFNKIPTRRNRTQPCLQQ